MNEVGYTVYDLIKIYENFIDDNLKNESKFGTIKMEFNEFKNEILHKVNELDDIQFSQYSEAKKKQIRESLLLMDKNKFKVDLGKKVESNEKFSLFENLKRHCENLYDLENYLSSFRMNKAEDLIYEWQSGQETFPISSKPVLGELVGVQEIDNFLRSNESVLSFLAKKEIKEDCRIIALGDEYSYTERLLFSIFLGILEWKLHSKEAIISFLAELYNISQHFGLKTEHFLAFNNLCKYLQFLMHTVSIKRLDDPQLYQAFTITLIMRTVFNRKIIKGIKNLLVEIMKVTLHFTTENQLKKILSLYIDEQLSNGIHQIEDYLSDLSNGFLDEERTLEPRDLDNLGKLVPLLCFAFQIDIKCDIIKDSGTGQTVNYQEYSMVSRPRIVNNLNPYILVLLYGWEEKEYVQRVKQAQVMFKESDYRGNNSSQQKQDHQYNNHQKSSGGFRENQNRNEIAPNDNIAYRSYSNFEEIQMKMKEKREFMVENPSKIELSNNMPDYTRSQLSSHATPGGYQEGQPTKTSQGLYYQKSKEELKQSPGYGNPSYGDQAGNQQISKEEEEFLSQITFELNQPIERALGNLVSTIGNNSNLIWNF